MFVRVRVRIMPEIDARFEGEKAIIAQKGRRILVNFALRFEADIRGC